MNEYAHIAERFGRDTANHQMTILHDDGLYRHLAFQQPGRGTYWFELVTAPGSLTFSGDGDSFTFRRDRDMFGFFRGSAYRGQPNMDYWAEKLTSGGRENGVMRYDSWLMEKLVREHVAEDIRDEMTPLGVGVAVRDMFKWAPVDDERATRETLESFEHKGYRFHDVWEWNFRDYHWWFVWACYAIVWGISEYDRVKAAPTTVQEAAL